ncbi:RNA helicase [Plasmodiophora brassicae]|nr:hypothetical protein PBRA_008496 [Plasmodiophora brassicae]
MDFLQVLNRAARFQRKPPAAAPKTQAGPSVQASRSKRPRRQRVQDSKDEPTVSIFPTKSGTSDPVPAGEPRSTNDVDDYVHSVRSRQRIRVKGSAVPAPVTSFADLNLPDYLHQNIAEQWATPTAIQMQAIPVLMAGRELLAVSPTGSGKTGAFMIPILAQLDTPHPDGLFRAVVVSPTIELAQQTYRRFLRVSAGRSFGIFALTRANADAVAKPDGKRDIVVATPARLASLIKANAIDLSRVEYLVFDEGDQLWDANGFVTDVDEIVAACTNPNVTRALFSATMPETTENLARTVLRDPVKVVVGASENSACDNIEQRLVFAGTEPGKLIALRDLLVKGIRTPLLIFVQTKSRARQLAHTLRQHPHPIKVGYIEADQTQAQRDQVVRQFRGGDLNALITTEVLARGIDFLGVNCVINYDFPQTTVSYIHRIGRTGRAGRRGEAITFFTHEDVVFLRSIAGVMQRSGCDVPAWILSMRKPNRSRVKELRTRPPKRKRIGAN